MKRKERGQGLVEYTLILLLVAIVVIVILGLLGDEIARIFHEIVCGIAPESKDCTEGVSAEIMLESTNFAGGTGGIGGLDAFYGFWDLNLEQEESIGEARIQLQELMEETLDILLEYADDNGDEVLYALILQAQQTISGDYTDIQEILLQIYSAIGEAPLELQVAVIQKAEPLLINAYWALDGAQVPYESFEAALQEIQRLEDQYPGSTGDVNPILWEIWGVDEQRNFFIDEGQPGLKYMACLGISYLYNTEIPGYIELAEQFEAQIPPCDN